MADQQLVNNLQTLAEEGIGVGDDKVEITVKEAADFLIAGCEIMSKLSTPLISGQQFLAIKQALTI